MDLELGELEDSNDGIDWSQLAEIYLLAPIQNAVVERGFSFQNIILTPQRSRIIIKTIGIKVFLKYVKNILAKEEIDTILDNAALMWATSRATEMELEVFDFLCK